MHILPIIAISILLSFASPIKTGNDQTPMIEKPSIIIQENAWLDKLSFCESGDRPNLRIVDTNGKYSYGAFQFQMATFLRYGKKYGILEKDISQEKAEELIYDYDTQKQIARQMMRDGLEHNWYNCYNKIGEDFP